VRYALLAGIAGWFAWDLFGSVRREDGLAGARLLELLWASATVAFALELDASLRLLGRLRRGDSLATPEQGAVRAPVGRPAAVDLSTPDVRRLLAAPAYAEHLERLRWSLPILAAGAVGSAAAALAWAEIPRPLDLIVAAMAGVSIAAVAAVPALRGWVRLAVARSRRGVPPQA
jgi:hypothetical protein